MIVKATIQPYVKLIDPEWIKLCRYVQEHPFCKFEIEFRDGKPHTAIIIRESIKF